MARRVRLDSGGMRQLLNSSGVRHELNTIASDVVAATRSAPEVVRHGMPVKVSAARAGRNRATAVVTIAHQGGLAVQAKHGTLTRAVAAAGVPNSKVRRRP